MGEKALIFAAMVIAALIGGGAAFPFEKELARHWNQFKTFHQKKYKADEEKVRRGIWEANLERVVIHNLEASMGKHTFTLAMNEFADLTGEEFAKLVRGSCFRPKTNSTGAAFLKSPFIMIPAAVDWRDKNLVTPVKDQKSCSASWAFAVVGSIEGQQAKKTGKLVALSIQQLIDCSGQPGCCGGFIDDAYKYIKENGGIDTAESYPFEGGEASCRFNPDTIGAKISGYADIPKDEEALTQAIAEIGPISVAIDASHFSFQLYHSGVYFERRCSSTSLDHAALVVGYGSENGRDYYLVKNSWGLSWGDKGFIKMARNRNNNCGIATSASYPLIE